MAINFQSSTYFGSAKCSLMKSILMETKERVYIKRCCEIRGCMHASPCQTNFAGQNFYLAGLPFSLELRCQKDAKHGVLDPKMRRLNQTGTGKKSVRYSSTLCTVSFECTSVTEINQQFVYSPMISNHKVIFKILLSSSNYQ